MSNFIHLTKPAQDKLRAAFRGEAKVSTADLVDRLAGMGYKNLNYRYNILSDAFALGLVYRQRTDGRGHLYTLTPNWELPASAVTTRAPRDTSHTSSSRRPSGVAPTPAAAYEGPAFGFSSLAPSVGAAFPAHQDEDGETTPYHGAQIVDALHRQFDSMFVRVE